MGHHGNLNNTSESSAHVCSQGFSGLNRLRADGDSRITLVLNALSYVDFYRPSYFLLENVRGILSHKLLDKQDRGEDEPRSVSQGMVKMICRALTGMKSVFMSHSLQSSDAFSVIKSGLTCCKERCMVYLKSVYLSASAILC